MIKKINLSLAFLLVLNIFSFANSEKESDFHFTENKGQLDSRVKFHTKLHVGDIFFEKHTFTFDLFNAEDLDLVYKVRHDKKMRDLNENKSIVLRKSVYKMNFLNSNPNVFLTPNDNIGYVKNYIKGNDPSKWASDVESFEKLTYNEIYNGISAEIYTKDDHLKYDFIVKAGANPNDILINYEGVDGLNLNHGILEISLPNTSVNELKPIAYQYNNGKKIIIDCEFVLNGTNLSFTFPQGYDNSKELIIDPTWIFSTLTGSTADNWGFTATYDDNDNFYGGGIAFSSGFPVSSGAYDVTFGGVLDAAIIKYNPTGTTRIYATYLGGSQADQPHSLVTNAAGELVVMGATASTNFPTLGAYDASFNGGTTVSPNSGTFTGGSDIFITKLNAAGNGIIGSTYLGGTGNDGLSLNTSLMFNYSDENRGEVVIDNNGDIYIASTSNSTNFPTTLGSHKQTNSGNYDAVVAKLSPNLGSLLWSSYLGGSSGDAGYSIRVNETNNSVVVCGGTVSSNIGTTSGVIKPTYGGSTDGYIGVFNNSNGSLNALSYLGTASYDQAYIVEIDENSDVYVTGQSKGSYPVTGGVYSNANGKQFIHKMNNTLTTTIFSTIFGSGSSTVNISITAFLVDNCSNIYVAGWGGNVNNEGTTNGMPVTPGAIKGTTDGSDFYFIVLERNATSLLYGTYFGHNSSAEHVDGGTSRFDKRGTIYQGVCAACGGSNSFPSSPGAYSSTNGSSNCNFGAIKIGLDFQGIVASADDIGDITLCGSPYNVDFSVGSMPPPNTFWDFGDGNTLGVGSDFTPMHTYADTGTYNVMYVAIDSSSCNIADTVYLDVTVINNVPLDAQIVIPPYDPCVPGGLTIELEFTGAGADSIYWNMGNGDSFINDTLINYTYTVGGDFVLSFQAWDFDCGGYSQIIDTIHFNPNFTSVNATPPSDQIFCGQPYEVTFDAGATPPPNNYWDFGDGVGTSTLPNLNYTYADTGIYTIMYVAIDSSTCNIADTAYFTVTINLKDTLSADFIIPPLDRCTDSLAVQFINTGNGDEIFWDMGNGTTFNNIDTVNYTYTVPGTYYVIFQAIDLVCNDTINIVDTVDYNPTYTSINAISPGNILLCAQPYDVNFSGNTPQPPNSYWDFGDGIGIDTAANPLYTYADTGTYNVQYVVIDSTTCNIADTVFFTVTIEVKQFNVSFNIPPYDPCSSDSLIVQFDIPGAIADSLYWNMGDGTTYIDSVTFEHTYTPGTYIINLEAYDFLCPSSNATFTDTVFYNPVYTAINAQPIDSVFSCGSLVVDFVGNTPPPPNSFWDFGNGGTSTQTNPTYTYGLEGIYTVTYVAIDSTTCNIADSITFDVQLVQAPSVNPSIDFEPPKPCEADSFFVDLQFTGSGTDSIRWDMGDGKLFSTNAVSYLYSNPGTYTISFTGYNFLCGNVSRNWMIDFIEVKETSGIIPNVFTPNGDDWNDELVFLGVDNTQDYSIRIFDRWGRSAYESTDPDKNWDGKNAAEGTYFYELRYTDICGSEEKVVTGTVTLLRGPKKQ